MSAVTDLIEQYGAYAGLAAVIGLGVLALLYFAQAREVKRLREWALGAAEREADLARRLLAQAGRSSQARSIASRTGAMAAVPKAGAAVGPATVAAATTVAKAAGSAVSPAVPMKPAATAIPDPVAPGAPTSAAFSTSALPAADAKPPSAPDGSAPMAAPTGSEPPAASTPAPTSAETPADATPDAPEADEADAPTAANGDVPLDGETVEGDALDFDDLDLDLDPDSGPLAPLRSSAARPLRAGVPSATLPPRAPGEPLGRRREPEPPKKGTGRLLGIGAGTLVGVGIAVLAATQLFGGDSTPDRQANLPAQTTAIDPGTATATSTTPSDPAAVNVAVLNGTTVAGLAKQIADRLEEEGYVRGNVTNAAVQNRSATTVGFTEGHRGDAERVAQRIGVGSDAIGTLDPADASRAGDAEVVVIVGADRTDLP